MKRVREIAPAAASFWVESWGISKKCVAG
jgi:hypothetical protein